MRIYFKSFLITFLIITIGCNNNSQNNLQLDSESVIATFPDGNLTINELQDYIINHSVSIKLSTDDLSKKYRDLVQLASIEKQMLNEAHLSGINELNQFVLQNREEIKRLYAYQFLANKADITISNEDLEKYYLDNIDKYNLPEIRYVYHFFKSNKTKNANEEIEKFRKRILTGESFKELAEKFSDSQSRHNQGFLGQIKRGNFSPDLDGVLFGLDINELSPVLKTSDGYHMFIVTEKLNAKKYELNEIKSLVRQDLYTELSTNNLKETALSLTDLPESLFIVNQDEFEDILVSKAPHKALYNIGDEDLVLSEFIFLIKELSIKKPSLNINDISYKIFQESAYSEIIYQYMLKQNIKYNNPSDLKNISSKLLLSEFSNIKFKSYINKNPQLIKAYFDNNKMRYVTPVKSNIQLLNIPIKTGINLMPELEASIDKLKANKLSLDDLANAHNGKVITSGLMDNNQLSQINKNMSQFLYNLELNQYTPPFTTNGFYYIIKVIGKTEQEFNPLPIVRERVINDYINNYKAQIFSEISQVYVNNIEIHENVLVQYIDGLNSFESL